MRKNKLQPNDLWMMVIGLFIICSLFVSEVQAQPKQRRVQQKEAQAKKKTSSSSAMSRRAQISFPTALDVPEDVVWRRDIYREINLEDDANAGLYYPVEPHGKQVNLFTYIFKLAQNGYIPIYEYPTDGSDVFEESTKIDMKTMLDNYQIFYEEQNGKLKVDNSDIPSAEVKKYYLKESAYYDQANAAFHRKVVALCPVLNREDDFGDGTSKYPLFWVKYDDLAPFLGKFVLMTSDKNNAATMSADDFFTKNMYKGKIYKTNNLLGQTLAQVANGNDSIMKAEQKKIEDELMAFEKTVWGDQEKKDSLDSIANAQANVKVKKKRSVRNRRSGSGDVDEKPAEKEQKAAREPKVRSKRSSSPRSSSSGSARVSVRRQRH